MNVGCDLHDCARQGQVWLQIQQVRNNRVMDPEIEAVLQTAQSVLVRCPSGHFGQHEEPAQDPEDEPAQHLADDVPALAEEAQGPAAAI